MTADEQQQTCSACSATIAGCSLKLLLCGRSCCGEACDHRAPQSFGDISTRQVPRQADIHIQRETTTRSAT